MTTANEPADDTALADEIFSSDREDRGGRQPAADDERSDGPARDERGRFAAKQMETEEANTEPAAEQAEESLPVTIEKPPVAEPQPDQNVSRHAPISEVMGMRKRAQEAERQASEFQAKYLALEALVQNLQRSQPAQQQQSTPVEIPDPIVDPEGYINYQMSHIQAQQRSAILDVYEDRVREKHGDEKVDAAMKLAQQTGAFHQLIQAKDPWSAMMKWSAAYNVRQTVGDDLEAYNKRIADEAVAKALEGLKAGNAGQAQPRFPGTLAVATATGKQGAVLTEESIAEDVFGSGRRRGGS